VSVEGKGAEPPAARIQNGILAEEAAKCEGRGTHPPALAGEMDG
jgi:hypothetical protein